jgi:PT repeat
MPSVSCSVIILLAVLLSGFVATNAQVKPCNFCVDPNKITKPDVLVFNALFQLFGINSTITCGTLNDLLVLPIVPPRVCTQLQNLNTIKQQCGCTKQGPTSAPTTAPTSKPTSKPSPRPTSPTFGPTLRPTSPTLSPTGSPISKPTTNPTQKPTRKPTRKPTSKPTQNPIAKPTSNPVSGGTMKMGGGMEKMGKRRVK